MLNNVSYILETRNGDRNLIKKQAKNIALFIAQSHFFPRFNSYIRNTFDIHDAGNRTLRQWNLDMTEGKEIGKMFAK